MTGKCFAGCVRYVMQKPGTVVLDAEGLRTDSVQAMVADFNLQRRLNPELEKAVGHLVLSWSVHDKALLSDRVMAERAREYLAKMQITGTQYLVVRHRDKAHPHLHIVYNRVNYEGKTIPDKFQRQRNVQVCRELTLRHGYYLAPGKAQVNRHRLQGADKTRYVLHDAIKLALQQARSWQELERLLQDKGITIDYKYKRGTAQVQGVSFRMGNLNFKGSALDRSLSYGAINRQLAQQRITPPQVKPAFASLQDSSLNQSVPGLAAGINGEIGSLVEHLLAPETALTAPAHLTDYPYRKKKRRKRKRKHL
ncbi:Relaxase/Mobilisation nuclease domain-containing protein [Pontibacter indicus]|uniref:Relaxase/Mobilisation nuclease domain-containing protein n=2 Tax=Pontibacter indicus TaxID=1317125 RepID=A0A1R3XR86_9BACT|nr:Relaxase/Mobilisation nuclease domain-containing protein [Pontibacter indicus]